MIAVCASALAVLFPPRLNQFAVAGSNSLLPPSSYTPAPYGGSAGSPSPVATPQFGPSPSNPSRSNDAKFGDLARGSVSFAGRTVPLPAGNWRVVASLPSTVANGVTIDMTALAQEEADNLSGLILLIGNDKATPSPTGFRADGNCERSDINFTHVVQNQDFGDQNCQYVDFLTPDAALRQNSDALLRAAIGELKQSAIKVPSTLVGANFRFGSRKDLLIAKFFFSPDADGIVPSAKSDWLDSDWNKYNIAQHRDKQHYIERLKSWMARWQPIMEATWNERLSPAAIADADRSLPN